MSMINLKPTLFKLTILVFIGIVSSCGNKNKENADESKEFDAAKESLKENIESVIGKIPPPAEIPFLLQATGADFNPGFVNNLESADSYMSAFDKTALNLGIYSADLGYLSAYGQTQEALEYLQTAKNLADHLGVVGAVDQVVLERFEKNIGEKDSLYNIINKAIDDVDQYLRSEQRNRVAALVTTGSFIEGLYISTELVRSYPKDLLPEDSRNLILTPVISNILKQKNSVGELIKLVESVQDENLDRLRSDLEQLQKNYTDLNIEEQIKKNRADLMLSDATLTSITDTVHKIRGYLVE